MHGAFKIVLAVDALPLAAGFAAHDAQAQLYGGNPDQEVYCASNDSRGTRCRMPWRDSALARPMSKAGCIEGLTWGSDPHSVWVKGGCRANFRNARGWGRPGRDDRELYCASNDKRGTRCQVPWRHATLSRQMSSAPCIEGQTWGSDPYSVWIKGGCRGQFREARGGRPRW